MSQTTFFMNHEKCECSVDVKQKTIVTKRKTKQKIYKPDASDLVTTGVNAAWLESPRINAW